MIDTRVLVLVGSLRADSLNRKIAETLRDEAPDGVEVDIVDGLGSSPSTTRTSTARCSRRRDRLRDRSPPPTGFLS